MILAPVAKQQFIDSSGNPYASGNLYSYAAGTTTPLTTYADQAGTPNANPIILDAAGQANIWIDPTLAYKFVLKDSLGSTVWTVDNINGIPASNGVLTNNTLSQDTTVLSGYTLWWANLTVPNGLTLTVNSGAYFAGFNLTVNGTVTLNGTADLV